MFESKQLRKEKKILKELREKFKNAFLIEYDQAGTTDTFTIDNKFVIVFDIDSIINVSRKDTTEKIISIDCKWHNDSDSQTKFTLFRDFREFAIKSVQNFGMKQEYIKNRQEQKEATRKAQEQKRIYMNSLTKALSKLK
jgi:hypothetical protein